MENRFLFNYKCLSVDFSVVFTAVGSKMFRYFTYWYTHCYWQTFIVIFVHGMVSQHHTLTPLLQMADKLPSNGQKTTVKWPKKQPTWDLWCSSCVLQSWPAHSGSWHLLTKLLFGFLFREKIFNNDSTGVTSGISTNSSSTVGVSGVNMEVNKCQDNKESLCNGDIDPPVEGMGFFSTNLFLVALWR